MQELLTLSDAAHRLGIHVTTLRAWIRSGKIPALKCGRKFIRVDWEAILGVLREQGRQEEVSTSICREESA